MLLRLNKFKNLITVSKAFLYRHKELTLFIYGLFLAFIFILSPRLQFLRYGLLDPSFNFAVDFAALAKLSFGTQFISTYGPLGFLVSNYLPQYLNIVNLWLVFYILMLSVGVYLFCLKYNIKKRFLATSVITFIFSITTFSYNEWNYLIVFLLYCFVYLKLKNRFSYLVLTLLSIVSGIFMLIKFTLATGSFGALILLIIFSDKSKKDKIKSLTIFLILSLGTLALMGRHFGINNYYNYIKSAITISSGFSQSMSSLNHQTILATFFVAISLILIMIWLFVINKINTLKFLFLLPSIYLIWKYTVVRQDLHLLVIFQFAASLAIIIYYSARKSMKSINIKFMLAILISSSIAIYANNIGFYGIDGFAQTVASPIINIVELKPISFFETQQEISNWQNQSAVGLKGAAIPKSWIDKIGNNSVDIYPWETVLVGANNLKWDPRPSPFSFETYEPQLDNLNASFYNSNKSPEFIIWHNTGVNSIDERYILWDEPKTIRSILINYKLVKYNNNFMLFKKRLNKLNITFGYQNFGTINAINKYIKITPTNDQLMVTYFKIHISNLESVRTILYKQEEYYMNIKYENNSYRTYRLVVQNTDQGIFLNVMPSNWSSLIKFFTMSGKPQPNEIAVKFKIYNTY